MFGQLGAPELLLIMAVMIFLLGAKKLPELARGSGRALRIFKAETKGLGGDEQPMNSLLLPDEVADAAPVKHLDAS